MKKIKLIRDKIPEIMKDEGKKPIVYTVDKQDFYDLLKNKLQEEVDEFLENDSIEELGDILEVIYAICSTRKISFRNLEQTRIEKKRKRGAFKERFVLELRNKTN